VYNIGLGGYGPPAQTIWFWFISQKKLKAPARRGLLNPVKSSRIIGLIFKVFAKQSDIQIYTDCFGDTNFLQKCYADVVLTVRK
jgi:hypothetical protein